MRKPIKIIFDDKSEEDFDDIEIEEMSNDWETMRMQPKIKQETLEEVAEKYSILESTPENRVNCKEDFIAGAKWQQERMYSVEEVYDILEEAMEDVELFGLVWHEDGDYKNLKKWFKYFEKK
jgi:molecular chaperone DnaK (HSP70)